MPQRYNATEMKECGYSALTLRARVDFVEDLTREM